MSGLLPSKKSSSSLVVNSVISEFSLNDFTEKERIGSGGEGEVFRGDNVRLGKVAVKRLNRPVNKADMSEVILLVKHSNHPNILRLFGLLTLEEGYSHNNRSFCIGYIMEYMENGSLFDVIHNTSVKYDMEQVYSWIGKASSGLQYLHEEGVLHRDIKPQNILLGKSLDDLRISDFGMARVVEPQTIASLTGGIGTIDYMAPELHDGIKYGKSADIYALTITFWEIIHRERPYGHLGVITQYKQINRILNGERPNIEEELEISALLKRGWDSNPKSRPEISEFIEFSRKKRPAQENLRKVVSQQNVNQNENKVEKLSGGHQNTSVLVLGDDGSPNTICLLNSKNQSWKKLRITLPMGMQSFGTVVLNEEIYIFGGKSEDVYQQSCYKLKDDGTWMKLASLNQKRSNISSSSLVYKGDIWVIGGASGDFEPLKSVEKYSQNKWIFFSQDKWTYMPKMNYARSNAAAAVFKNRIFVTGGYSNKYLKSVEMFNLKLQKWILFCDLPIEVAAHTMLISNSILSIFGGKSEPGKLNSVWEMDIEDPEKKWTKNQSLNWPRESFGIGKLSNGIIVFGGWGGSGKTSEIFDGNKWLNGPNLPQFLSHFAYTSIPRSLEESFLNKFEEQNTSVLILGGWKSLNKIYLLDSKAQSWKKLSITLPVEMRHSGAVVVNEEIYIFGGFSRAGSVRQDCYKLKDDGSWMKLASLNQERANISSSSLVYKGDIWVIGGYSGRTLNSVEKYNITQNKWIFFSQDKWTYMPEMNYARWSAAAAVFKDRIFVAGGWNGERSVEMFDPKLQKWFFFCNLPVATVGHTMLISNSTLSIFGGDSFDSGQLNSVWEMDIEDPEKKWTEKQSFKHSRKYFGIGNLSNGIIVFGGYAADTAEIFDGNKWIDGPELPQFLSHFAYTSIPRSLEESFLKKFEEQNTSVLILGGAAAFSDTIYLLDSKAQSWKKLRIILPVKMRSFGAVVLDEEIYIFGGFSEDGYKQDCYKLKDDGSWVQFASMNKKRVYISSSSLVYKGDIWAIGGASVAGALRLVEKYDISQDKWIYMPEMNYARCGAAAAVFKNRIFVTGGWNYENLKSVEMFDPKLQKWILFCDLPIEVSRHTMLISNSTLSIFGGISRRRQLNSVWEMDIEDPEKKWTKKQSFKYARWLFGIGKFSYGIIVFGGLKEESDETSEIFDRNKWIDGPKLPQKLTRFAFTSIPRSLEERFLMTFS